MLIISVSPKLAYEIFYIELWHILSLILFIAVNYVIYRKARKGALLYSYLYVQSLLLLWIISKILKTVSPNITLRWIFIVTQYFGASFLGGALIIFASIYSHKYIPSLRKLIIWNIPCFYCFIVVVLNPLHHQFYSRYTFYGDDFGSLFYINMIICYLYIITAIIMLSKGFFKMFGCERIRALLFACGVIIPLVINILYVLDLFEWLFNYHPLFDYTPIASNASLILFALAAFQYRFLDILPIAGRQVYDSIGEALVIIDSKMHILDCNQRFTLLFPDFACGRMVPEILLSSNCYTTSNFSYKIIKKPLRNCQLIKLIDITNLQTTLNLLKQASDVLDESNQHLKLMITKKRHLAEMKVRTYLLQEMHDLLGHTLVSAICMCEAELRKGNHLSTDIIEKVNLLLHTGYSEFHSLIYEDKSTNRSSYLILSIQELLEKLTYLSIKTEYVIQEEAYELSTESTDTVLRICQEALTNILKHSNASEISIVFRYLPDSLELFLLDNGKGCSHIQQGSGLKGMKNRTQSIGGWISFFSDLDCGFYIHAIIPKEGTYVI